MNDELSPLEVLLLDHAGAANPLSIAYGVAADYLAEPSTADAVLREVRSAVLHLLDLGLIVFFWASARDGYHQTSAGSVLAMTREEVEHEFDLDATGTAVEDETNMVFFIETPQGREAFLGLPADLVPRSKRRRMSS